MDAGRVGREGEPFAGRDPAVVEVALGRLPAVERSALELVHDEGCSDHEAAAFLGMTRGQFRRLLSRARRRLVEEYERLQRGLAVVFGSLWRAGSRAWRRTVDAAAGQWRVIAPVADVVVATVAAALMAAATALLAPTVDGEAAGARGAQTERGSARPADVPGPAPVASTARVLPHALRAAPVAGSRAVGLDLGPVRDPAPLKREGTIYGFEVDPPVSPPDEPKTGISPGPIGVGVGYHCPPPGERPSVVFDVVCALEGK